jgi:hypothetical protein
MAECAEDMQEMMAGKYISVNDMANTAYLQKIKDFMRDEKDYMLKHPNIAELFWDYLARCEPVVMTNMQAEMNKQLTSEGIPSLQGQAMGMSGQALPPEQAANPDGAPASLASQQSTLQNYGM